MIINIPKNQKCLMDFQNDHKDYICVLSPFMYMNYNDAVKETINLIARHCNEKFFIVDFSGLTITFLKIFNVKFCEKFINQMSEDDLLNFSNAIDTSLIFEQICENQMYKEFVCNYMDDSIKNLSKFVFKHKKLKSNIIDSCNMEFQMLEERSDSFLWSSPTGFALKMPKFKKR